MQARTVLLAVLWIASLALAWMFGSQFSAESTTHAQRSTPPGTPGEIPDRSVSRDLAPGELPPTALPGSARRSDSKSADPRPDPEEEYEFTLEGVETLEELSARFMRYADIKLRQGPEGQMELLRKTDALMQESAVRSLMRDEREGMRLLYPWIRFLVDRESQVLSMTETIYRKAANEPALFEGLDDDTLEVFTEGVAMLLPSAVDAETLDRCRKYAEQILAMPKETLPEALQKNFGELRRNLEYWAAPLTGEALRARVTDPAVPFDQRIQLLSRAREEDIEGVDLVGLLERPLAEGNRSVVRYLSRIPLSASDAAALDRSLFLGVETGRIRSWEIRSYLSATHRNDWAQAQALIEEGLRRGGASTNAFAQALLWVNPPPPKSYVESLLASYDLDDGVAKGLRGRFGIK